MRVFDIYISGIYKRSIVARNYNKALEETKKLYPYMNEKFFEIKERKYGF